MDDKTLRMVQMTQLEIAVEIKRVCDLLNINYFLDSGTLLGAVRHKGFIPWDDDLDMGMLRTDYDRFLNEAPAVLDPKYFLQSWTSDKNYGLAFAKVRKNGTIYIEEAAMKAGAHQGVYVDIFPYDVYPDDEKKRSSQKKEYFLYRRLLLAKCGYQPWIMSSSNLIQKSEKRCVYTILKGVSAFVSKDKIIGNYKAACEKYNHENSEFLYAQGGASNYGEWLVPRNSFKEFVELDFENQKFKCPVGYKEYLTTVYHDYMQLPPEEKRVNRHKIIEIRL